MHPRLFDFELRDLGQVQPWGAPEDPNLHWFGLSDGMYWLNVGDDKLFEYSSEARERLGFSQYCDYQVVRLYEDLLEITPYVLEAVPSELRRFVAPSDGGPWDQHWHAWCALPESLLTTSDGTDLLEAGAVWLGKRALSSLHLASPANISMWSDTAQVHVCWDNRSREIQGVPAWSAQVGMYSISRETFLEEVREFHSRFMSQMAKRVELVVAGGLPDGIRVDLEGLAREHRNRSRPIDQNLAAPSTPTDWARVASAVQTLEALRSET